MPANEHRSIAQTLADRDELLSESAMARVATFKTTITDLKGSRSIRKEEMSEMKISLRAQLEEVDRELKLRQRVYAHQVSVGKMRMSVAEYHMLRLRAVKQTLERLIDDWEKGLQEKRVQEEK
jgi:hypothetical protein